MSCHAVSSHAMDCHAISCHAMFRFAVRVRATPSRTDPPSLPRAGSYKITHNNINYY